MPFLSAGKTVIPNAAVSLVLFVKDFGIFSERDGAGDAGGGRGGGEHSKTFSFYLFGYLLPFLFVCSCFPTSSRELFFIL